MRCLGANCGKEGDGKFCDECGAKMVEEKMDTVVICNGKLDDGSACGTELVPAQKFCKNCGTKVDQSLFCSLQVVCPTCGNAVEQDAKFCMECGYNLKQQIKSGQQTMVKEDTVASIKPEADLETSTSTSAENSSETDETLIEGSKDKDTSIQDGKTDNTGNEGNVNQANDRSGHLENIESKFNADTSTRGQGISDEVQPEVAGYYDVEMIDNESGAFNDEIKQKEDIKMDFTGNITTINESSNSDLSEQLKDVHIGRVQQGNITIVDSSKTTKNEETAHKVKQTKDDESKNEDADDDTVELQSNGNGQVKRSKSQKENEKKRKQDEDNTERQNDQEMKEDGINEESKNSSNPAECEPLDSIKQTIETVKLMDEDNTEKQSGQEVKEDTENAHNQDSFKTADNKPLDSMEQIIETVKPKDHDNIEKQSDQEVRDDCKNVQNQDSSQPADCTHIESTEKIEKTINKSKLKDGDSIERQSDHKDEEECENEHRDSAMHAEKKSESSPEKLDQSKGTDNPKDLGQESNIDGENGRQKNDRNEAVAGSSKMVFGPDKNGKSETGNNEVKAPFGKKLFTLNDNTDEGAATENKNGNDKRDGTASSMDTTEYNNDLDDENEDTSIDGTDVDKDTERQTRSMTRAREETKTNKKKSNKSKASENQRKAAESKTNEKRIKIMFHVLTSEEFKFEPSKDKCILVLGNKEMGGWKRMDRLMKNKRKIEGCIYEMVYEEMVPTRLVAGGQSIPYKYVIIKQDKPEKEYWEHYMKNYKAGEGYNRDLTVSLKLKSIDIWHQFDCFMEQEPKSLRDKLYEYFKMKKNDFIQHAEKAAHIFCPCIIENDKSYLPVDDIILQLKMLNECMRKIYFLDGKCWNDTTGFSRSFEILLLHICQMIIKKRRSKVVIFVKTNGGDREKVKMEGYITSSFMRQYNLKELQTSETREKREQATIVSLYLIYIVKAFGLLISDRKSLITISKALLIEVDNEKKECPDLCLVDRYFTGKRDVLLEAITSFIRNIAGTSKDPFWLSVLPWLHFLSGQCTPFEVPPIDVKHDKTEPVWWGVAEIQRDLAYFKGKSEKWSIPVEDMLKLLQPLFDIDYLLPRSFIAAVDLRDLQKLIEMRAIPVEACIAHLTYRLKTVIPYGYFDYGDNCYKLYAMRNDEKTVQMCVNSLLVQLQEAFYSEDLIETQWEMSYIIASQMLLRSISNKRVDTVYLCVQILIHCIAMYDRMISEKKNIDDKRSTQLQGVLKETANEAVRWVETYNGWSYQMKDILDVWNNTFAPVELQSENVRNSWNKILSQGLMFNLEQKACKEPYRMKKFVEIYCQNLDSYNPSMQECMGKVAFVAIENGYTVDFQQFLPYENERFGRLLSQMFVSEWEKNVKTGKDESMTMLRHVLRWPPFTQYLKISYQKLNGMLSKKCLEYLALAISIIESRITALLTGALTIGDFSLITERDQKFQELGELLKLEKEHTAAFIRKAIEVRQRELNAFQMQAKQMATLTSVCTQLANIDRKSIDDTLEKQEHLERHQIKEFCLPADVSRVEIVDTYQPRLCAFRVSQSVIDVVPDLHACCDSSTFMKLWNDKCREVCSQCANLDDVVQKVWSFVKNQWDELTNRIKSGCIKFKEFERLVGQRYRDDYDQMKRELKAMNIPEKCISQRLDQLMKYQQLETCVKGAKTILKFAKEYNLKGNFSQISVIATHGESNQEMKAFDNSVMKACEFLKDLTLDKEKCLQMFVDCKPLVQWLKESMETSGLKELKVFVDLAFMSAGDEPINIARVQCLHSAVTGYAPLIFDLDEKCGYKELLNLCDVVWKELEANPKLPEKLQVTNRQLQWLKEIKKAHGSVEVTSLMQAEAINANGIFTVGKNTWKRDRQTGNIDGTLMELSDILKLTVPEQEGKRELRNYTFSQLQDLQSRLMLVAGKAEKGSDNVDRFTMIFDSITRLSSVYIKLCSSGCVLFKDWRGRFFCDPRPVRPVCTILEFGQGDGAPQLKGRRSDDEDLKDIIPVLANFMETCLEEWLKYIKEKRKSYLHLNYFTVDQLVILQRELVKMGSDLEPTHHIYPLLSAVKGNCTPDDLLEAMAAAKEEIEGESEMDAGEEQENDREEADSIEDSSEDEKEQKFVQELVEAGYEEGLAIKALEFVDINDSTEGIMWCMDHADTDISGDDNQPEREKNQLMREHLTEKPTFTSWSQSQMDIQTMITANISGLGKQMTLGSEPLITDLKDLWNKFLESISSNIRDYLSLEHLGLILKHLASKDSSEISRDLPPGFKEGQPNLIICPSGDVLMTTLSVYMMDRDQPLPQSDEILMCTSNTTKDEVDIFWRRAIFDGGRKIHCLVNADMLDYDVSEAADRCLEEYLQEVYHDKDLKYRLLVICGSDNEYKSTIVSSLDKYKRQPLPQNISHLRQYLSTKLTISQQPKPGVKPAAYVDHQRYSVRVIKSWRAGVGKTLYKNRRENDITRLNKRGVKTDTVSIPLQEKTIDLHYVIERLSEHTTQPGEITARLFHIDVSHEVENGVDYLLFNLLTLGCLTDKTGFVWRKSPTDLYLIETMPLMFQTTNRRGDDLQYVHPMLNILPDLTCRSPLESIQIYSGEQFQDYKQSDQLFDEEQFRSAVFQRTFQYLLRLDEGRPFDDVQPDDPEGDPQTCLETLLRHCGLEDPSWSELHHFVWFLNTQLVDFENNMFVSAAAAEDLPGFSKFVLRFLIQMSRDFSTRSLDMKEESPGLKPDGRGNNSKMEVDIGDNDEDDDEDDDESDDDVLQTYQMRRTWESSPHPYLFFNSDRFSFTFLGFYIERGSGNLIDQQTGRVLERGIMTQNLYDSLIRNHAPLQENFDDLPRGEKILKLCKCMGLDMPHDPDDTYELTTDNVKKIMAIYMRFRCDIPVIIMGETGCGKTRLVKFMCSLQQPPGVEMTNMILMKVHGGTTNKDIIRKVKEAEEVAQRNKDEYGDHMYTVLFFDEANTTEAIGLIKEIMCDKSLEGKKLKLCENLKMVAACNPYRKHSEELIKKLEQAGLGYHVDADETTDRLGRVPMRRLVYRVQPLPQSLLPLVWDFGQLNTQVEDLYIRQMVRRYIREDKLPDLPGLIEVVSSVLTASQEYMREQRDECSFVSLRDVDRVLTVMSWFYQQSQDGNNTLFNLMDKKKPHRIDDSSSSEEEEDDDDEEFIAHRQTDGSIEYITRSLILAVGVCYHACLKTRPEYREHIAQHFTEPCELQGGEDQIQEEIESCQEVFLDNVHLEKNIARNMALRENVFMMVVCIELRIPLFLVGKPGSSKSLAKTIVSDAMQGNAAKKELFKELKQAQMVSFQCSPLATPETIVATFRQCAQFQKDKDLDTFVSIVVLDEVGLAEDSPRMPLKTLHPLLEDGCQGDEEPEKHKKVAFIGISNWALDPAKMNRGILVQREVPDLEELENSAKGICHTEDELGHWIEPLIEPMANSYLEIFEKASKSMREFYGLRDFYSLVKMVYGFVERSKQRPTWYEMLHAIMRNFGGLDQVNPVESFKKNLSKVIHFDERPKETDPDCSPAGLVQACLFDTNNTQSESRYLLLLTENYGTLTIIQQQILSRRGDIRPITIFGSSFRSDQEYTQVCRNINKIKVCMETGNTVVLLNLENLYESLYDALNQYYVCFGGERYVDLGLGTHRVKCPVHRNFRLIVVAEKQTVYKKFPIPLINRLEKHFLTINTMLSPEQQQVVSKLEKWAEQFVQQKHQKKENSVTEVGDVFIGYHDDTCSAIVLDVWDRHIQDIGDRDAQVLDDAKSVLLWCATPESLYRLENSGLSNEEKNSLKDKYLQEQAHDNFIQYMNVKIVQEQSTQIFTQITTHSKLMASVYKNEISKATGIRVDKILLLETLSSFDTEQQFSNRIQQHIQSTGKDPSLMVIQCDSGDVNANLIACARYCVMDEFEKMHEDLKAPVHIVFIVQLPRGALFTGFQCGLWHSVHIDDLYTADMNMPALRAMQDKSVAEIFNDAVTDNVAMETEDTIQRENVEDMEDMEWSGNEAGNLSPRPGTSKENYGINMETQELGTEYRMGGEPLQLHDVLVDLQNVDKHHSTSHRVYGQNRHNVKGLVLACVQAALSMVKDKEENTSKETDRVTLVLKLLHQEQIEGQASFLHGVCCLIAKLLKEKESKTNVTHMAKNWLTNEAASKESINKAGTFRRSCIQTLETKVAPILAGIIAYLDTNDNIKLLQDDCSWKQELFLKILNTVDAISLKFTDLLSPTRQSDLQEVFVMTTGCEGHLFSARMPFSWVLINQINEILKLHHPAVELHDHDEEDDSAARAESSVNVLNEQAIGKVLDCVNHEMLSEALHEYIHDFVHTMYHAASAEEHQLVCQTVVYVTTQVANNTTDNSLLHSMVNVHIAYQKLAPRLNYFRAMNIVWPECSSAIIELKAKNPDHFMFKEQEFTFSALCLLLENLSPKGTDLNNPKGRSIWLNTVHRYRPVVEKVIRLQSEDKLLYGAHSVQSVRRAKGLWSRVMVVKLFLEHVCASETEDKITIKYCMPLWKILTDEADLKQLKSLEGIEKFLKSCNRQAMKEYMGEEVKCCLCESVLEGPPFVLPCKDILCDQCFDGMKALEENSCGKCHKEFTENWEPQRQIAQRNAIEKLKDYQKRCNTFFMDVVSQLCFADNTAPSNEVIQKLLGYIFFTTRGKQQRTRNLTIFDTGIDPNPVFRSFLLQLLMRTSEENVNENLEGYLREAAAFIRQDSPDQEKHYIELCLLVIQCLEDKFTQDANCAGTGKVRYASEALRQATQTIDIQELNVEKLYGLASARMGLAVAAKYIADIVMNDVETRDIDRRVRKLIEEAQKLCEDTNVRWTRIYLVKQLCRCYGVDVYQAICRSHEPFLRWINMRDLNRDQVVEVSDRYIVCGDRYKEVREAVTKVVLGEDIEHLEGIVEEHHALGGRVETILQLAVHREITSSYLYPQQKRKLTQQVVATLTQFIDTSDVVRNKELMHAMVMNQLVPRRLAVIEGANLRSQGIQCLIVHYLTVLSHFNGTGTLLQPLIAMMTNPQAYINSFLPTMPQDDLEDVKEALLAARTQVRGADHNPVFYRCPNGHPYVIGDCGRPYVVARCKCGAEIGGQGHNLLPTNRLDTGNDNTMTGHILGRANARGAGLKPERTLTPAYCAAIRLLLHMAMYIGSGVNQQGIQRMIRPDIAVNDVCEFLWTHINQGIDDLHRTLGRSVDDVLLLMHIIVDQLMRIHNDGENVAADVSQLSSKDGRRRWETTFCDRFLQATLQNLDNNLKAWNQNLAQDQRLGADPLLCLLYETDTNVERENSAILEEIPRVWRYRTPISLEHLRQEVDAKVSQKQHKVLQLFLKEDHHLRALRYIPSILRLHRALFQKYQRKLDKAEASQITVAQLKREEIAGVETIQLLTDFTEAWELVRESLALYLCPTELGGMIVSKEYCKRTINDKTPISMLLPTIKEAGLCSYALLDFLMRKQNDFLDRYLKESHRKPSSISSVIPKEVSSAHLISYDPQHDILPLVLANCQYSFEMGKGTKIEYDFAALERQLMDRFLFSKSRIDVGRVLMIDQMIYRTEFTNAEVFKKLADKIPQETLSTVTRTQICSEVKSLPDLCTSLDNLDITISFLKSTGGEPDKTLHEFMETTLQMDTTILSQKAQQACELKHARSLWLLLSLQKSKKMIDHNQHTESTFESLAEQFHEEIPDDLQAVYWAYMKKLSVEKLTQLLEVLYEYILLVVAVRQNPADEDYTETFDNRLQEWLYGYVEGMDNPALDLAVLADFPKDILYKHSVHTWVCTYNMLVEKQTGNTRRFR